MKKVCVLLNGTIDNDARVIKVIKSLSTQYSIDLFYTSKKSISAKELFNKDVKLIYCPNPYGNFRKKIQANLFFFNAYLFFINEVLKEKKTYHFIWANDLPTLKPAYLIKQKMPNARLIYDSHEIYTETINQFFDFQTKGVKRIVFKVLVKAMRFMGKRCERKYISKVDLFITVGDAVANFFQKTLRYPKPKVVKNCPHLQSKTIKKDTLRNHFKLNKSDVIFLYQGVFNEGRGLRTVINAFGKADEKVKLILLGEGTLKNKLQQLVKRNKLQDKVFILNKVPYSELFKYTSSANFGVNYVEPLNKSKELASPNKVFEYIQNEVPILMSNSIENRTINSKYGVGVCTEIKESSILQGIEDVQKNDFHQNIKEAKLIFNWENESQKLLEEMKKIE